MLPHHRRGRRSRPLERITHRDSPAFPVTSPSPPSPQDVRIVRSILQKRGRLPPELVDLILNEAEYYSAVFARRVHEIQAASNGPITRFLYLVTPALPKMTKKLKFVTQSHDQGWSGERNGRGTYSPSYTWLDAVILRPEEANTEAELSDTLRTVVENGPKEISKSEKEEEYPGARWKVVGEWLLQRNVQTEDKFKVHEITWELGVDDGVDMNPETGAGRGKGFMEALTPGDRVAVLAKAVYPGWVNHVNGVEVQTFYSD